MSGDGSPRAAVLGRSKTNARPNSSLTVEIAPEPLAFYRPETNELLVVDKEKATAFLNEVRLLDKLMHESVTAKDACFKASQALLVVQREASDQGAIKQAQSKLDLANQALETTQKKLENEFKPLGKLDATGGKLYELIPIAKPRGQQGASGAHGGHTWAKKWTYVRSDKIKSHFRGYPLNQAEQDKHQSNKTQSILDDKGKIDTAKLRKQLSDLQTSAKWKKEVEAHGVFFKDLNTSIHDSLDAWATGLNGGPHGIKIDPEFQLLRYFAGAGVEANWNPKKGNMAVRANASAEFAIAEGRFSAACYWPAQAGLMLEMTGPKTGKLYKAGLVRGSLELKLAGIAGASASAQLGVTVDYTDIAGGKVGMRGRSRSKAMSNKAVDITKKVRDGADVDGAVDLFAGARANGSVKGGLEWNNPEEKRFTTLCTIGPGGQVQAGAGFSGTFQITFAGGKFRFLCAASACLGVGAGGKLEFEVDAKALEFSKYVAYMLYAVGYEFTGIFLGESYKLFTDLSVWAIKEGKAIEDAIAHYVDLYANMAEDLATKVFGKAVIGDFKAEGKRISLMNHVLSNPEAMSYATPEAKGLILYQLTRHDFYSAAGATSIPANTDAGDYVPWNMEFVGRRKRAIVAVCKKTRSKAEFRNVMQHMTIDGSKDPKGWRQNFVQVKDFLDKGADMQRLEEKVGEHFDSLAVLESGKGLQSLYENLYDKPVLGYPFVDNTNPQYIARVGMGHHHGYAMPGGFDPGPDRPPIMSSADVNTRYV